MTKPRIAVIIGSTRDARFAEKPAKWIFEKAKANADWEVELVDLKEFDLPLFNEVASNAWAPSEDPRAVAWQKKVGEFDGFIFVVAEYNHSVSGSLKNALDQASVEWKKKAFGAVGYGGVGAARAIEHLRGIGAELEMVSVRTAVHIGGGDFFAVHPMGGQNKEISEIEGSIGPSAEALLSELDWWTRATKTARG